MSNPTTIQAKLVPFTLGTDGTTYKNVVCLKVWNFSGDTSTAKEETQCGVFTGLNANESSFDFEIVANTTASVTEYSAKDILGFWNDQTQVYAKVAPAAGLTISGPGYLTNVKIAAAVGSLVTMTGTFSVDGEITVA